MVEIQTFFHGAGVEVFELPEVPRAGDLIRNAAAGVYRVAAVLWQPAAMVKVFAVPVLKPATQTISLPNLPATSDWIADAEGNLHQARPAIFSKQEINHAA